jgi:chorismate dehydratase
MIKTGVVEYLNTLPLIYGLQKGRLSHKFELIKNVPSRLADDLKELLLDIALIPAIEYARLKGTFYIVPDLCIGADGPVKSVSLFFKKELSDIRRVALDTSSRTSVAMARLILSEKYNIKPEFISMKPDLNQMLKSADAAVMIGDIALEEGMRTPHWLDLAEEWKEWTGYPFVFALWAARDLEFPSNQLKLLSESLDLGMEHIDDIAEEYAQTHPQDKKFYADYLRNNIQYRLTEDHLEGLRAFWEMSFYHGLTEQIPDIRFFEI